jgi:fatty acid desaturase
MVEIAVWALAAILLAVACVVTWFFLKLFFRLILVVIAISFFIAFLYHFSLLPESFSQQVDAAILKVQEIVKIGFEKKPKANKTKKMQKQADCTSSDPCEVVFC